MLYAQIQSDLTVLIDVSLLLVPMLFVAYVVGLNRKVEVAEVKEVEPEVEVEVAEVNEVEPEVEVEVDEVKEESLMNMLDRVSEEVERSIHAWYEGSELLTEPMEVKEARLRFKKAEELVVSVELFGNREFFKVQKIGSKYVYALNFEGTVCKLSLEGVKFWSA